MGFERNCPKCRGAGSYLGLGMMKRACDCNVPTPDFTPKVENKVPERQTKKTPGKPASKTKKK